MGMTALLPPNGGTPNGGELFGKHLVLGFHDGASFLLGRHEHGSGAEIPSVGLGRWEGVFSQKGMVVLLPFGGEVARRLVEDGQVESDAEAVTHQVGAVRAIDVVDVKAVEGGGIPGDALYDVAAEGEEQAVHDLDAILEAFDGAPDGDDELILVRVADLAEGPGQTGRAPIRVDDSGSASHANGVAFLEMAFQTGDELPGPDFYIVVRKYDDIATGGGQTAIVALTQGSGIMNADDLRGLVFEQQTVVVTDAAKSDGVHTANDDGDHRTSLRRRYGCIIAFYRSCE